MDNIEFGIMVEKNIDIVKNYIPTDEQLHKLFWVDYHFPFHTIPVVKRSVESEQQYYVRMQNKFIEDELKVANELIRKSNAR